MADFQTSAEASFSSNAGAKQLIMEEDSDPGRPVLKGQSYVRVFPSAAKPVVTAVMGAVSRTATNVTVEITDYVSFDNTSSSSLKYAPVGEVTIEDERFFKAEPTVIYDEDSNSLVLDLNAYGICRVTYTAAFDQYRVTHGDDPCARSETQTTGDEEPAQGPPTYDPAFLVAEATGWESTSITVQGPPCEGARGYGDTIQFNRYEPVGLRIEEDSEFPIGPHSHYFTASKTPDGFTLAPQTYQISETGATVSKYIGGRLRVYPRVPVTLFGVNCAVSQGSVGQGTQKVARALTFAGASSIGLPYPASSAITVNGPSQALDLFNEVVSIAFALPGDEVNEVKWENSNSFELIEVRTVREDEIVVVTALGNNTLPCFTFCEVIYTSDYYKYDVLLNYDPDANSGRGWYGDGMVIAYAEDGRRGSIELKAPPYRGAT